MTETLQQIITELSKGELLTYLKDIPYLSSAVAKYKKKYSSYEKFISNIVKYCEIQEISQKVAGDIDLLHTYSEQNAFEWQVYEFTSPKSYFQEIDKPDEFMARIDRELQLGYKAHTHCIVRKGVLWFSAYIENIVLKNHKTCVHAAYNFHSSIIVAKFSNNLEKDTILKAVTSALKYQSHKELMLKGHCVSSLMRLHFEKNNSGYKRKIQHLNPLVSSNYEDFESKRKKVWEDCKSKKDEYIRNTFGPNQQPKLQDLLFYVINPETFNFNVKFSGPSVLDGFREMVELDIMKYPLPKYLETIRETGKNAFVLQPKQKTVCYK